MTLSLRATTVARAALQVYATPLLLVLLLAVPVLLAGDAAHHHTTIAFFVDNARWNVDTDQSYIEIAGYAQLLLAAGLLLTLATRQRSAPVFVGWAAALVLLALDDMLQWHEAFGAWLADSRALPEVMGLRTVDLGELLLFAALGTTVVLVVALAHWRSGPASRRESRQMMVLLAALAPVTVVLDMASIAVGDLLPGPGHTLVIWAEAAVELGVMSALLAFTVRLALETAGRQRPWTNLEPPVSATASPRHEGLPQEQKLVGAGA